MKPIDRRPHPLIVACAVGALFALGACSSSREVSEAAAMTPTGSGFSQNLHKDYVALAESELKQGDRGSATHYALKAKQAAAGQAVAPDEVASRSIDPPISTTLSDARTRLVSALGSPEATKKPEQAAKAQTMFDCWMEQQEEGWQYDDIAACRKGFDTAMLALAPEKVAEKAPEQQVVHFKFDSTELTEQSQAQMADLVREVQLAKPDDGIVEAVSLPRAKGFVLGVQWHPEHPIPMQWPLSKSMFDAFGAACRAKLDERHARASSIRAA